MKQLCYLRRYELAKNLLLIAKVCKYCNETKVVLQLF